ncbi:MAG: acetamidase/formamidase family protein [Halanaerobiaceae bacterium]
MKIAKRNQVYYEHSRFNDPGIIVNPGDIFKAETELNTGSWLTSTSDNWLPEKSEKPNPTVCIEIAGAEPGDVLKINVQDIKLEEFGYTGYNGQKHPLANLIYSKKWGINTKTVPIKDNYIHWNETKKIPVEPMIGTMGVAPATEVLKNTKGGIHGGNMDVNEVTSGNIIYLPVFVPGALLHLGDVHAIQGDGEINGAGGIECRSLLTLKVDIIKKPKNMNWIRIESDDYIMTVSCCRSVEESFYEAAREMIFWMVNGFNYTENEAYLLMGEVMEARCTQFVNPTRTYICKMPKKYL